MLKAVYTTADDIPEQFRELYSERNGNYELTGVQGVKTQADVDRISEALAKERNDHKAAKATMSAWAELGDLDEIQKKLDRLPELELAAKGKIDENTIEEMVSKRVSASINGKTAPLERELQKMQKAYAEIQAERDQLAQGVKRRSIHDAVQKELTAKNVVPTAIEDALLYAERAFEINENGQIVTRDGVGVMPGLDPSQWLMEIADKKPHWFGESRGSGATGGNRGGGVSTANNPWSADHWNMTAQGAYIRQHGLEKAQQLAKAAGTSVGGMRPRKK